MAIRTKNYLIPAEIPFAPNFHRQYDSVVNQLHRLARVATAKSFKTAVSNSFKAPNLTAKVTARSTQRQVIAAANILP